MEPINIQKVQDAVTETPPGTVTSVVPDVFAGGFTRTVANGNVQGDHSSPNPFFFRINEQQGKTPALLVRKDVGYPDTWTKGPSLQYPLLSGFPPGMSAPYDQICDSMALSKALEALRPGSSQIVLDLAESAATRSMLSTNAKVHHQLADLLYWVAKPLQRKLDRGQRLLDAITSRWLEYRYGWTPLLGSIYDAASNLRNEVTKERDVVGSHTREWSETASPIVLSTHIGDIRGQHSRTVSKRARYALRFKVDWDDGAAAWSSFNPALIAWELLPLSFVADWVIGIGDHLAAMENWMLYRTSFLGGYVTYTSKLDETGSVARAISNGVTTFSLSANAFGRHRGKERVVLYNLPMPTVPVFQINLGAKRQLDAAALFHTLWGKQIRRFL